MENLLSAIKPLLPGLIAAGLFVVTLVVLRVALRKQPVARKLRFPSVLFWLYLLFSALAVVTRLHWPAGYASVSALALLVLALAIILAVSIGIFDLFLGRYRQVNVPTIVRDILVVVVYVITIFAVLRGYGVNLTSILTTSAVLTAIIGFALQDLLSNIISGIALQIERPIKVGEYVMFNEQQGKVLEMNWRSTKIQTLHRDVVVIPNNVITRSAVINFSDPTPVHRRKLSIGLRYEVPPNRAKASILRALRSVDGVLSDPSPFVLLKSYDDFSIAYRIHFYIDQFDRRERIEDDVYTRLWYQLKRDGLSIPFPIRDINVRNVTAEDEQAAREQDLDRIITTLQKVPFLEPLSNEERRQLARDIKREYFSESETVIRQGKLGDSFYIIADGEVDVRVGERTVATLGRDDFFGEMSLMTGESRTATIVTRTDCEFFVIDKQAFHSIVKTNRGLVEAIGAKLEQRRAALDATRVEVSQKQALAGEQNAGSLVERIRRFFNVG